MTKKILCHVLYFLFNALK